MSHTCPYQGPPPVAAPPQYYAALHPKENQVSLKDCKAEEVMYMEKGVGVLLLPLTQK
ncbi:hypothetical protein MtrunA17_Chr4g0049461 [Medicago truncatula]|uniref:Uncharacterized protein n=1 Tax=Medicago truncatula TaxID=3880 RepID=A0A396IFV8_MEDTR|nr:hypothetical protein MtrunA17_Chr4g0049461 [Medicago truncatula]